MEENNSGSDREKREGLAALIDFLEQETSTLDELAEAIGDSAERLARVVEGAEPLGRTAYLALLALKHGLSPISGDD